MACTRFGGRAIATALACLTALSAFAQTPGATPAFEQLKTLAGTWEAKGPDGKIHTDTWSLISAGSVMMESMQPENVVTMYHLDGDRLMMTHYCMLKNQPRMVAEVSPDGKNYSFTLFDITNLASADTKHMNRMVMTLEDAQHYSQVWFVQDAGKERTGVLHYARKP